MMYKCIDCGNSSGLYAKRCPECYQKFLRQKWSEAKEREPEPKSAMATKWNEPLCSDCGQPYIPGTGQRTIFGGWFCNDCLD